MDVCRTVHDRPCSIAFSFLQVGVVRMTVAKAWIGKALADQPFLNPVFCRVRLTASAVFSTAFSTVSMNCWWEAHGAISPGFQLAR